MSANLPRELRAVLAAQPTHIVLPADAIRRLPARPSDYLDDDDYYPIEAPHLISQGKCLHAVLAAARNAPNGKHLAANIRASIRYVKRSAVNAIENIEHHGDAKVAKALRKSLAEAQR